MQNSRKPGGGGHRGGTKKVGRVTSHKSSKKKKLGQWGKTKEKGRKMDKKNGG